MSSENTDKRVQNTENLEIKKLENNYLVTSYLKLTPNYSHVFNIMTRYLISQ